MGELAMPCDLDKYWGVTVKSIKFDHFSMSLELNLFWTADNESRYATLSFLGVSGFELVAKKIFRSDVVELISLEAIVNSGRFDVKGELSNYDFSIRCDEISNKEGDDRLTQVS